MMGLFCLVKCSERGCSAIKKTTGHIMAQMIIHLETSPFMVRITRDNSTQLEAECQDFDKQYLGRHHVYSSSWNKKGWVKHSFILCPQDWCWLHQSLTAAEKQRWQDIFVWLSHETLMALFKILLLCVEVLQLLHNKTIYKDVTQSIRSKWLFTLRTWSYVFWQLLLFSG